MTVSSAPPAAAATSAPMHIAGDAAQLSARQRDLVALAAELGRHRFAPRAALHDREASFPRENFDDLRRSGLLGLCVPEAQGGLGADFATYLLVAAELGRHCGATALSFNMHACASLWAGAVSQHLALTPEQRTDHERSQQLHGERIAREGCIYAQPFSEGGAAAAGTAPFETRAQRVPGGYRVSGRKIFASLAGVADFYGVLCTLEQPGRACGGSQRDALYLAVAASSPGVSITGGWDPLGMRGTASRTLELHDVFVPEAERLMPEGLYHLASQRCPHLHATLSAAYMGIAQAAYDFTVQYLRADLPGMPPVKRRMYPTKQFAVAEMRVKLEQARALFLATAFGARADPDADARMRLYAAHFSVMEHAQAICAQAVRTCGGQSMLKSLPLERLYRDARCGSLMLPWTADLCLDHLGREALYAPGEGDEAIDG